MKKNVIYTIGALGMGLFLGYLIFGTSAMEESQDNKKYSSMDSKQTWSCAMHPQIVQSEPGDCPICGMDLTLSESHEEGLTLHQFRMTENAMALANIQTSIVGDIDTKSDKLKLSGKIKVNEEANVVQVTHFKGRIEELFVNSKGENVRKGQLLATVYSPELVGAQQELLTAMSLKKSQPELYNAVRNKLKLWKLTEKQINQIENSAKVKEVFPIYATVSGVVSMKMVETGDYVKRGQILYKISDLSTVWATFDAYENQISLLKEGQKVSIKTNAYVNKDFNTNISFIDPVLNTKTRTITIRSELDNKDAIFKPGMFVEGVVSINSMEGKEKNEIMVPKSAVLWTGKRSVVYIKTVSDQPIFEMREVILGMPRGEQYVILEGVKNGEEIVTNGTFTVDAAAQLQGKKSMMNKREVSGIVKDLQSNEDTDIEVELTDEFQKQFIAILSSYFLLKDALVASDSLETCAIAKTMVKEFRDLKTSDLSELEYAYSSKIEKELKAISKNDNLANQRAHFVNLNENISIVLKGIRVVPNTFYVQKCPMANNNKGAVWISKEKEIKNPYFGEEMLACGSVINVLKGS
ncbi:efflux transporter periplasmic adaptor subunit [Flavobacteriaceae bacterium (ex Bugula neritina AB1)]|nr:efflux transporter periplasmic adaptor subunit [Flavobacteriaceae bacterium (ex Bugula neritina AB1)]